VLKVKKVISLILSLLLIMQISVYYAFAGEGKKPVLRYSFEDADNAPSLFGNASLVFDEDKRGNVLSLDGSSGTYAEIPQGFFDGRDVMTIQFDILTNDQWGNFFTFCLGADSTRYSFFKIKNEDDSNTKLIRNCISTSSWQNEQAVSFVRDNYNGWMHIALVYDNYTLKLYVEGIMVSENTNTGIKVSDLGSNLYSYLGKSLYDGDGLFHGCFDNFEVYDCVLSDNEIALAAENNIPEMPDLRYTFEDETALPALFGNAATSYDDEKNGKVLSLDGTSETYAEIPRGYFDNKDEMTIAFDIKALSNSGNYFTFAFGQDSTCYDFFRVRGSEIRNGITVDNYYNEREVKTTSDSTDSWMSIALVFDNGKTLLYVNGSLASTNNAAHRVSELGSNLLAYFGKSFYDGDGYFNGLFDNFEVYNSVLSSDAIRYKAMAHLPLLNSVSVGEVVSNIENVSGTDSHTMVSVNLNRKNGEISSVIQQRQNLKAVPVKFSLLNGDCALYIDGREYPSSCTIDLSYDRSIKVVNSDTTENYTLKAAQIANNPVLPGMYADPDIDVLDGKFWIYPTTDGIAGWGGTQFHAFSSKDMVHWCDEGVILDNKDKSPGLNEKGVQIASSKWSNGNAWAPSIEGKNGKYYFYYCGRILSEYESLYGEGMAIGVAWANSPAGPYTASDEPILYPKMMSEAISDFWGQVIDPAIYTEGNTSYILFGNGRAFIAQINSDMLTVNTSTIREINGLEGFRESVAVFKRKNVYYWHWSCDDTGSENYHVEYGTSTSLTGEITYRGVLLEKDKENGILATAHQSIVYLPDSDKCFIAYHRFYTPLSIGGNVGHRRETCIEEVTFNDRLFLINLLNKVTPTMNGAGARDINGNAIDESISYASCTENGSINAGSINLTADEAPEIKATGHQYAKFTVAPTCSQKGYDEYFCTVCGDSIKENFVDEISHDVKFVETDSQKYKLSCKNCGYEREFDFSDYINLKKEHIAFDDYIDRNGDGIINAKDYAMIIKNK
jgi:beta-xylosidase